MAELEKRGLATVALTADGFIRDARRSAENFGLPDLPIAVVPETFTNHDRDSIREMVTRVFSNVVTALTRDIVRNGKDAWRSEVVMLPDDWLEYTGEDDLDAVDSMNREFLKYGWSDGFPLVPPTERRLEAMMKGTSRSPDDLVAVLEPGFGMATVRALAANAVMAGCLPEHLPVLIAAVEGLAEPVINLRMKSMSTGPKSPLLVVNGPIATRLGINSGRCALGPGALSYANTVIGRAIRLIMMNVGHCYPDVSDLDTIGSPIKYSMCVAENERSSPWNPYHVDLGYDREQSTATVHFVYGLCELHDFENHDPLSLIEVFASAAMNMAQVTTGMWLVGQRADPRAGTREKEHNFMFICPDHAAIFAANGWSKDDIRQAMHRLARLPFKALVKKRNPKAIEASHPELLWLWDSPDALVPVLEDAACYDVAVLGGVAGRGAFFYGAGAPVTKAIEE
jgi:hypothetical protein